MSHLSDALANVLESFFSGGEMLEQAAAPTKATIVGRIKKQHKLLDSPKLNSLVGARLNSWVDCGILRLITEDEKQFYAPGPKYLQESQEKTQ